MPPNSCHRVVHTASHDERDPIQTPTRAMGGKKAGGRGGCGHLGSRLGQPDSPSLADADRTTDSPEATGTEWGWSMELDDTGSMGRFIVLPLSHGLDAGRPGDPGPGR